MLIRQKGSLFAIVFGRNIIYIHTTFWEIFFRIAAVGNSLVAIHRTNKKAIQIWMAFQRYSFRYYIFSLILADLPCLPFM